MTQIRINVEGLDELKQRMEQFPRKWKQELWTTLKAVLFKIWELVPPYPPKPVSSSYRRTGTLGRSLGSGYAGGIMGQNPEIFEREIGAKYFSATFGTRLEYAPFVIGDKQTEQAKAHQGRWWTMPELAKWATQPVLGLFEAMLRGLARWLEGQKI